MSTRIIPWWVKAAGT